MVKCLRRFWRVFQNGLVNLVVISAQSGLPDTPIFLAVSALISGLLFSALSCMEVLAYFVSCFPVSKGIRHSWRDLSELEINVLVSLIHAFLFVFW